MERRCVKCEEDPYRTLVNVHTIREENRVITILTEYNGVIT